MQKLTENMLTMQLYDLILLDMDSKQIETKLFQNFYKFRKGFLDRNYGMPVNAALTSVIKIMNKNNK